MYRRPHVFRTSHRCTAGLPPVAGNEFGKHPSTACAFYAARLCRALANPPAVSNSTCSCTRSACSSCDKVWQTLASYCLLRCPVRFRVFCIRLTVCTIPFLLPVPYCVTALYSLSSVFCCLRLNFDSTLSQQQLNGLSSFSFWSRPKVSWRPLFIIWYLDATACLQLSLRTCFPVSALPH